MLSVHHLSRLILAIAFAAVLVVPVGSAVAASGGAQKMGLLDHPGGFCSQGATGGQPTQSFAVINFPADKSVTAEVVLKGAVPNTTYEVALVQTPNNIPSFVGALGHHTCGHGPRVTTNGQGNGGPVVISESLLPGTTGAYVIAFDNRQDALATPLAPLQ